MAKSLVQQQFGANAAAYATSRVHARGASLGRLIELVAPQRHWRALDVATGAGHTAAAFAPHVAHVTAGDITAEMLDQARKLGAEKNLSNMDVATADAEALPFADRSFDLVTCRIAPHHFADVARFVAETWRVLTPGGTFALVDNVAPSVATTSGFAACDLGRAAIDYNAFEKARDPSHGRALPTSEWVELFEQRGFAILHSEHLPKAMDFATWCRTMSVAPEAAAGLKAMLTGASPALTAFLQPTSDGDRLGFVLTELILIGLKRA